MQSSQSECDPGLRDYCTFMYCTLAIYSVISPVRLPIYHKFVVSMTISLLWLPVCQMFVAETES